MDRSVNARGILALLILGVALAAGTATDRPREQPRVTLAGYRVLAADFHIHSSMWSNGGVTPWGLVLEAKRQGLDVIAVTGHNQVSDSKVARWFARRTGGPVVLAGEEIHTLSGHHVIAVGIDTVVKWQGNAAAEIDEVHRQGGVAIAAHPGAGTWGEFDEAAMVRLDGSEVCHPMIDGRRTAARELEQFAARAPMAAIGSSDFHGIGRMGECRTYVFARDASADAVLEALRAHRTVVYGRGQQAYGDPWFVRVAAEDPRLRDWAQPRLLGGWLNWVSRAGGVLGLAGFVIFGWPGRRIDG